MDFTDIIKFFNGMTSLYKPLRDFRDLHFCYLFLEMAERHDAKAVIKIARDLVLQIQTLIDNK
jgi:hypothetical protein